MKTGTSDFGGGHGPPAPPLYTGLVQVKPQALLPVLVFIHGGRFTNGAGWLYDGLSIGTTLLPHAVLVVTFNYRLAAFGSLTCMHVWDS